MMAEEELGIDGTAVDPDLEMDMRPCRIASLTDQSDRLPPMDVLTHMDQELGTMSIASHDPMPIVDVHLHAIVAIPASSNHDTR